MKAAVAALTDLGFTSAHSASLMPSGFLGSLEVVGLAVVEAVDDGLDPDKKAAVAAFTGLGLTSAHSASLMPSGFLGSAEAECLATGVTPDMKAAVGAFTDLGFTSAHSASLMPSGFLGSVDVVGLATIEGLAPDKKAAVAAFTDLGFTSAHSASLMPSGFLGPPDPAVVVIKEDDGLGGRKVEGTEGLEVAPDMKAAVAEETGLGFTSAHSASDIPAGFLGEVEVVILATEETEEGVVTEPDMKAAAAEETGLGFTSAHSASLIPAGFWGSDEGGAAVIVEEVGAPNENPAAFGGGTLNVTPAPVVPRTFAVYLGLAGREPAAPNTGGCLGAAVVVTVVVVVAVDGAAVVTVGAVEASVVRVTKDSVSEVFAFLVAVEA